MEFIIGLYLVGYFISFGIALEFKCLAKSRRSIYVAAAIFSFLSWINIGTLLGEFYMQYINDKQEPETTTNEQ
jgi:hypothetical protein